MVIAVQATAAVLAVVVGPWRITKHTKVVVEGMVLLHHDDDVLHILQVSICQGTVPANKQERRNNQRPPGHLLHDRPPRGPQLGGVPRRLLFEYARRGTFFR